MANFSVKGLSLVLLQSFPECAASHATYTMETSRPEVCYVVSTECKFRTINFPGKSVTVAFYGCTALLILAIYCYLFYYSSHCFTLPALMGWRIHVLEYLSVFAPLLFLKCECGLGRMVSWSTGVPPSVETCLLVIYYMLTPFGWLFRDLLPLISACMHVFLDFKYFTWLMKRDILLIFFFFFEFSYL